jgi:hypothetical protein
MSFATWLQNHLVGWHFLLPIVVAFVVSVALVAKKRSAIIPWLAFSAWGAAVVSAYVSTGSHQLFNSNRLVWGAHVGTIGAVSIIPIGLAVLVLLVRRGPETMPWPRVAGALVAGLVGIPLANVAARTLGQWLIPLLIKHSGASMVNVSSDR